MSNAVRYNTSRRQILQTQTAVTYFPWAYGQNIPYGAKTGAYSGVTPKTAEAVGSLVGTVGSAAAGAVLDVYSAQSAQQTQLAMQREQTRLEKAAAEKAKARGETLSAVLSKVPWVVGGIVAVAGLIYLYKRNRSS